MDEFNHQSGKWTVSRRRSLLRWLVSVLVFLPALVVGVQPVPKVQAAGEAVAREGLIRHSFFGSTRWCCCR